MFAYVSYYVFNQVTDSEEEEELLAQAQVWFLRVTTIDFPEVFYTEASAVRNYFVGCFFL